MTQRRTGKGDREGRVGNSHPSKKLYVYFICGCNCFSETSKVEDPFVTRNYILRSNYEMQL